MSAVLSRLLLLALRTLIRNGSGLPSLLPELLCAPFKLQSECLILNAVRVMASVSIIASQSLSTAGKTASVVERMPRSTGEWCRDGDYRDISGP